MHRFFFIQTLNYVLQTYPLLLCSVYPLGRVQRRKNKLILFRLDIKRIARRKKSSLEPTAKSVLSQQLNRKSSESKESNIIESGKWKYRSIDFISLCVSQPRMGKIFLDTCEREDRVWSWSSLLPLTSAELFLRGSREGTS